MSKNLLRQRVIGLLGGTQERAAEALGITQHGVSQLVRGAPQGIYGELVEAALDTLSDEQLRAALTLALEKRAASVS